MKKDQLIISEKAYERGWFVVDKDIVACGNGVQTIKEVVRHPGGAVILVVDGTKVLLEKQYRYAVGDFVLELPAGKLNPSEKPEAAAIRELEEECGYLADDVKYLGKTYPCVGYSDEVLYMYYVDSFKKTQTHFDNDEDIECTWYELDEVLKLIKDNVISDAKTITTIYKYILETK